MRKLWLALLIPFALGVSADRWGDPVGSGGSAPNVATDTNGDGRADYILVGDYDQDGTLEMADIQAAHDRLRVSTYEGTTKPTVTARIGAACDGGTGSCLLRSTGSWTSDGFAVGDSILIEGYSYYDTTRTSMGVAVGASCTVAGGASDDCFTRTSGSFVTDGFTVGMVVYSFGFLEANESDPLIRGFTIEAVDADEMEVSCHGTAVGSSGCLVAETQRAGRWLISPGINGVYTIDSMPSATEIKLTETLPKEETVIATDGSGNPIAKVQDTRPIHLELVTGDYAAPVSQPAANMRGILELESYTTLTCPSRETVLHNNGDTIDAAVVAGRQPWAAGYTRSVHIKNCGLDGGWDDGGASASFAMGFQLQGFFASTVSGTYVEDTGHTGYYTSNSWDLVISDFAGSRLGNPRGVGLATTQAGVYIFATAIAGTDGFTYGVQLVNGTITDSANAYNFRRNAETDEIWGPIFTNVSARDITGVCANMRGVYRMTADGIRCNTTGGIQLSNGSTAWGQDSSIRYSTFRNIVIVDSTSTTGPPFLYGDYHDHVTVENLTIIGSSGTQACMQIEQPVRDGLFRGINLTRCAGDGIQVTGVDTGSQYISGNLGFTIESLKVDAIDDGDPFATNRNIFQATTDMAGSVFRDWRLEGVTGQAILLSAATCRNCTFENIYVTGLQPRFIGIGLEAWANGIVCDEGLENAWLTTTNASGVDDCTFSAGTAASQSECYCDGDGTWVAMAISGANQDVFNFTEAVSDSVFRNITIKDCRNSDAINFTGAVIDTVFENIRIENTGSWGSARTACVDGIVSDANASNSGNHLTGLSGAVAGQLFAWNAGAEPTGAAGSQDDFDLSSQFPLAANPGAAVCTTGQIAQTAGTDGFDVCEAGAWMNK